MGKSITSGCSIPPLSGIAFNKEAVTVDVAAEFKRLTAAALDAEGFYQRGKNTLTAHFEQLDMNDKEKAKFSVEFMAQMTTQLATVTMQAALKSTEMLLTSPYELAKLKLEAKSMEATYRVQMIDACLKEAEMKLKEKELELKEAQIEMEKRKTACLYGTEFDMSVGVVCREMTLKEDQWEDANKDKVIAETSSIAIVDTFTKEKTATESQMRPYNKALIEADVCLKGNQAGDIANLSNYKATLTKSQAELAIAQISGIGVSWANSVNAGLASVLSTSLTTESAGAGTAGYVPVTPAGAGITPGKASPVSGFQKCSIVITPSKP